MIETHWRTKIIVKINLAVEINREGVEGKSIRVAGLEKITKEK